MQTLKELFLYRSSGKDPDYYLAFEEYTKEIDGINGALVSVTVENLASNDVSLSIDPRNKKFTNKAIRNAHRGKLPILLISPRRKAAHRAVRLVRIKEIDASAGYFTVEAFQGPQA